MIELLKQQFSVDMSNEAKINKVRELLQLLALKIIYDKGFFNHLSFTGGTALRVLYDLRRFSEDLDFSLINKKGFSFLDLNSHIEREFKLYGLNIETKIKDNKTVPSTFLKFSGLLKELSLSDLPDQKLSIKIEVDSNPPQGGHIETSFVNKIYMLNIVHFDLSSLYATKLHACFFREYIKGRDFYDLVWYLSKKIQPNYTLLNNAIKQTQKDFSDIDKKSLGKFILSRIDDVDFKFIRKDVERFLEDKSELNLLTADTIKNILGKKF